MSERIYDAWRPTDRCSVEFEDVIKPEKGGGGAQLGAGLHSQVGVYPP